MKKGVEWKQRRLAAEELRESTKQYLWAYGFPLASVPSFKCLVRILMALSNYWIVVVISLKKLRKKWAWLMRILGQEGENTVSVLLFGSDTWVITPCMVWDLEGFQHSVDQRITGRQLWYHLYGRWEYLFLKETMWESVLEEFEAYALRRNDTNAQYIMT